MPDEIVVVVEPGPPEVVVEVNDVSLPGPTGIPGAKGDKGDVGLTGPEGPQGPKGDVGTKGDKGDVGLTGPAGPKGSKGDTGTRGATGPQGSIGLQGPQGIKGDRGSTGSVGPQGATGPTGPQGITGPQGAKGIPGTQGPQGLKGDQGDQGLQGPSGSVGSQGIQGPIGLTGPQGNPGPQGDPGPQGIPGVSADPAELAVKAPYRAIPFAPPPAKVTVVSNCDSGWTQVNAAVVHDSTVFDTGTASVKLTATNPSQAQAGFTFAAQNWSNSAFGIRMRFDEWAKVLDGYILISTSGTFSQFFRMQFTPGMSRVIDDEWIEFTFTRADFDYNSGTANWATVNGIRVQLYATAGNVATMWLDQLIRYPQPARPTISLAFDDGYATTYTVAKPKMDEYGFRGTLFAITGRIGTNGYVSQAQVDALSQAGWDISGHGETNLLDIPLADAEADVLQMKKYLIDRGYKGGDVYAYPNDGQNFTIRNTVAKYFAAARGLVGFGQTRSYLNRHRFTGWQPGRYISVASVIARIDRAIATNGWEVLSFHNLPNAYGQNEDYLPADFRTIIDYIASSGVQVLPVSEALAAAADEPAAFAPVVTDYTTPGDYTYAVPVGATVLEITTIGAGGGGGGGSRYNNTTAHSGGGGGGGGAMSTRAFAVSLLSNSTKTLLVHVGAGTAGGAAATGDTTNGTSATLSDRTEVYDDIATNGSKSIVRATGGGGGGNGASTNSVVGGGGGGIFAGASGGVGSTTVAASVGGNNVGGSGGGGGGGFTSAGVALTGGAGGSNNADARPAAASTVADPNLGGAVQMGIAGVNGDGSRAALGGRGGGTTAAIGGGKGGDGGWPGGGGAGGGASLNGLPAGAGGKGGDGAVRIVAR